MIRVESLLYTGSVSGTINLWDLDTLQLIRSVKAHRTDVLSLAGIGGFAFSGSANGYLKKWDLGCSPQKTKLITAAVSNVSINGKLIQALY
jgi:WD40 repeat protein